MILAFCFCILFSNSLINISSNPSINALLQVKNNGFNTVFINNTKSYEVETKLLNTSNKYDLNKILLKLNIYNKQGILIGSKLVNVNFSQRMALRKAKGFFETIWYNIKNFTFKDNIRNKIREDRTISVNQEKQFIFFFYDNDISAKVSDKIPVSISVVPHSARINK